MFKEYDETDNINNIWKTLNTVSDMICGCLKEKSKTPKHGSGMRRPTMQLEGRYLSKRSEKKAVVYGDLRVENVTHILQGTAITDKMSGFIRQMSFLRFRDSWKGNI